MQQGTTGSKVSMRHLYLYAYLLMEDANRKGREVRLEWGNISTASIGPDPAKPERLVLTLPQMASVGTEEDAKLLRALISHEILCHGHHTDFGITPDQGIAGALANVLEDPRGELRALGRFAGSKSVIREGIEILVDRGVFTGPPQGEQLHPAAILVSWLVCELRAELLGQKCLEGFASEFRALAIQTFGSTLTAAVKVEALQAARCASTGEVVDHSRQILELLKLAAENPPPPPPAGGDGDPEDQDDQGDEAKGSQGGAGDDSDKDEQQKEQGGPAGQDGGQDSAQDAPQGAQFEPDAADLKDAVSAVLQAQDGDLGAYGKGLEEHLVDGNEAMASPAGGSSYTHEMGENVLPGPGSIDNRVLMRADAKGLTAALSLKMEELLEARALVRRNHSTEGVLKSRRVFRVALGDLSVFERKSRSEELDTCVMLLGDESGSMGEAFGNLKRSAAANRVVVGAGEVLNDADVPFAVVGFNTRLKVYKSFDDAWAESLKAFALVPTGSTNTHLAVVWALRELMGRSEARKILLVAADGDPGKSDVLQAALNESKAYGVEVRFVLIGDQYEHQYQAFEAPYGVAKDADQLANAVFGCLEAALA